MLHAREHPLARLSAAALSYAADRNKSLKICFNYVKTADQNEEPHVQLGLREEVLVRLVA
jgi:hypothetical protein